MEEAMRLTQSGSHTGKIVFVPREEDKVDVSFSPINSFLYMREAAMIKNETRELFLAHAVARWSRCDIPDRW